MGDVIDLPLSKLLTPEAVLEAAKELQPTDLLVIGLDKDGKGFFQFCFDELSTAYWYVNHARRVIEKEYM
jgi:hypothetical protein